MKNPIISSRVPRQNSGFTLVEMLVVIAIIAILAGIITVASTGAINAAKRGRAAATASQIQTAILSYNTEYGVYPVPTGSPTADVAYTGSSNEADLMVALCGNINAYTATTTTSTVPNTRQIAYLTPKKTEVDTTGIIVNPFTPKAPYAYFSITVDSDYSGIISAPDFSTATNGSACPPAAAPITQGVGVWADCDTSSNIPAGTGSNNPQYWVHTY